MSVSQRANLRSAYLYLICLVTLVMVIFSAVSAVRNIVQLAYPDPGYFGYEPAFAPDGKRSRLDPAEEERRKQAARDSQQHQAVLGLVGSGTMLLIAGPAYLYHWRRVQSETIGVRPADDTPQVQPV